jgi:hypothetical protein
MTAQYLQHGNLSFRFQTRGENSERGQTEEGYALRAERHIGTVEERLHLLHHSHLHPGVLLQQIRQLVHDAAGDLFLEVAL